MSTRKPRELTMVIEPTIELQRQVQNLGIVEIKSQARRCFSGWQLQVLLDPAVVRAAQANAAWNRFHAIAREPSHQVTVTIAIVVQYDPDELAYVDQAAWLDRKSVV